MYQNTTKSITVGLKLILIYLASIINFNYFISFSIFHNTTKRKDVFSLKGTTFVISSDWWISELTINVYQVICNRSAFLSGSVTLCTQNVKYNVLLSLKCKSWRSVLLVEETAVTDLPQVTGKLDHPILYRVHLAWAWFKLTALVVISTDCTCMHKSNNHKITTTTTPG